MKHKSLEVSTTLEGFVCSPCFTHRVPRLFLSLSELVTAEQAGMSAAVTQKRGEERQRCCKKQEKDRETGAQGRVWQTQLRRWDGTRGWNVEDLLYCWGVQ